jgi:hypothetical protein
MVATTFLEMSEPFLELSVGLLLMKMATRKKNMLEKVCPNHISIVSTTSVLRYRSNHFNTAQLAKLAVKLF